MTSENKEDKNNLENIVADEAAVERDFHREKAEWTDKENRRLEGENLELRTSIEFLERIVKSDDSHDALVKIFAFLVVQYPESKCEIKLYASRIYNYADKSINEFRNTDLAPEDIILKNTSAFGDMTSLTDIIKDTVYMMVAGKKPVRVDNTRSPFSYLEAHDLVFRSMVKSDLESIAAKSGKKSEYVYRKLISLVGMSYNEKQKEIEVQLSGEDPAVSEFYKGHIAEIMGNIDNKMEKSVRKCHYTYPIIIGDKVVGDIHISHDRNPKEFDYKRIGKFDYYVSIVMKNLLASTTDSLTQLNSRPYFDREAPKRIEHNKRHDRPVSLVMIDIDDFKKVNDSHGHPFGDEVLRYMGNVLNGNVRTGDIAARYGGEEFVLLLPETPAENALDAVEKIRLAIESGEIVVGKKKKKITASCGFYTLGSPDYCSLEEGIQKADIALYYSKLKGKNRITMWSSDVEKEYTAMRESMKTPHT